MYMFKRRYTDGHVCGVKILHVKPRWHVSPPLLEQGRVQGWLRLTGTTLTVRGENRQVVYEVIRIPGHYCCHCEQEVGESVAGATHVASVHPGVPSPDPNNPHGHRRDNFYTCVLKGGV